MYPSHGDKTWCRQAADGIAENVIERAKAHAGELYWDPGFPHRSAQDRSILECSLGFGTPGIFLFLAELGSQTDDLRVNTCIRAAAPRLLRRLETAPPSGFYVGAPGALVALLHVQRRTQIELVNEAAVTRLAERILSEDVGASCALSNGHAGTLLAIELLQAEFPNLDLRSVRELLLSKIVSALHVSARGLVCGRQFDAIKMPVGFYSGTSGIRHVLGQYQSPALEWIRAGLSSYEDTAYDAETAQWHDYVNERFFNDPGQAHRFNRALLRGDATLFERPGKSIGWGAGSAGILLTDTQSAHVSRTLEAVRHSLSLAKPLEQSMTIFDGLAGVATSASFLPHGAGDKISAAVLKIAHAQYQAHRRLLTFSWESTANLNFLNGEAGIGLYLLSQAAENSTAAWAIFPQLKHPIPLPADRTVSSVQEQLLAKHFPLSRHFRKAWPQPGLPSVAAYIETARQVLEPLGSLEKEVCDYECLRLSFEAARPSGVLLSCRDAYTEDLRTMLLGTATDQELLTWKVRRVLGSKLGVLPFSLPATADGVPTADKKTLLLLYHQVDRLHEKLLTPEVYQILSLMEKATQIKTLVAKVQTTWLFKQRAAHEAEATIFKAMREGLTEGYIEFL